MSDEAARVDKFIERWSASRGTERAVKDQFFLELCDLLQVERPDPGVGASDSYRFEKPVHITHPDGSTTTGFIDFYRAGAFLIEAKHGSEAGDPTLGTARRGSAGWRRAMQAAFGQACQYAASLPEKPPFLLTCDIGYLFEIWTGFSGSYGGYGSRQTLELIALRDADKRDYLRTVLTDPWSLDPTQRVTEVTRDVAAQLADLALSLERSGHDPELVAQFLMRCIFTLFAEDVGLLPEGLFTRAIEERWLERPHEFASGVVLLWRAMDQGLPFGFEASIKRFNGGLFRTLGSIPLSREQLKLLLNAARCDWSSVEPTIFGTLLERALLPAERDRLGAHFTPREYIERLVRPTVIEPVRAEWDLVQGEVRDTLATGRAETPGDEILVKAIEILRAFHRHLCGLRILDPACGTGNFLFVTLDLLKEVEAEVLKEIADLVILLESKKIRESLAVYLGSGGKQTLVSLEDRIVIDPHQFLGLEANARAREIAELVLWIGYLQWHRRVFGSYVPEPVLHDYHNIVHRDAVLASDGAVPRLDSQARPVTVWDMRSYKRSAVTGELVPDKTQQVPIMDPIRPREAEWPEADFIVSNPPFIGNKQMRRDLGDGYTEALRATYPDVPGTADLVMYWWDKAARACREGRIERFGMITTNSISQTFNRGVLEQHLRAEINPLAIAWAIPDHPWTDAGADVRIAMTVGARPDRTGARPRLGTVVQEARGQRRVWRSREVTVAFREVEQIHADLTGGPNLAGTIALQANRGLCFQGMNLVGKGFRLSREEVRTLGYDPEQLPPVIRPYMNARELAQRSQDRFVIDLYGLGADQARQEHPRLFQWLRERVKPERDQNKRESRRRNWWLFGEPVGKLRKAWTGLDRYIVTPETSRHRFFVFQPSSLIPDHKLYAICLDDAYFLGVLSSRPSVAFILASGGRMGIGNDPIFNNTRCFDPFPFPEATAKQARTIRDLAEQLDRHRKTVQASCPGAMLTAQYHALERARAAETGSGKHGEPLTEEERTFHRDALIGVLRSLHDDLDAAVAEAYGWPADLPEAEILGRLVALNAQRAEEEAGGKIRWLRASVAQAQQTELLPQEAGTESVAPTAGKAKPARRKPRIVSPIPEGGRGPWPKTIRDQLHAVRSALLACSGGMTPEEVARTYKGAHLKTVRRHLETLESLGVVISYQGSNGNGILWRVSRANT